MNDNAIDNILKEHTRRHLSPSESDLKYVAAKYAEVDQFLSGSCFKSGSFARYTAIRPIHDLDIIWRTDDERIWADPEAYLQQLAIEVQEQYEEFSHDIPNISVQTHSITLLFDRDGVDFSIDIVPATETGTTNSYGDPIFKVPEVIKYNHEQRSRFYATHEDPTDVKAVFTDPKGYINAAVELDRLSSGNYRKTTKLLKAWRNGLKKKHGDKIRIKAFHLEQVCVAEFEASPSMTVYEALRKCMSELTTYVVDAPMIEDRAYVALNEEKFIDSYLVDHKTTEAQKILLIVEISVANRKISGLSVNDDIEAALINILDAEDPPTTISAKSYASPQAPWLGR